MVSPLYAIYPNQLILLNLAVKIMYIEGIKSEVPRYVIFFTSPMLPLMSDYCSRQLFREQYQSLLVKYYVSGHCPSPCLYFKI
jgi:hypothetical protein